MPGSSLFRTVAHGFRTIVPVVIDLIRLAVFTAHWRRALAAENLFLRKQLALFQERKVKTSASQRFCPLTDGHPESDVPVAWFPGERQSGYVHLLASQRIAVVLALEIQTDGTPPVWTENSILAFPPISGRSGGCGIRQIPR